MSLKGNRLIVWSSLTPSQAYYKIAQSLKADPGVQDYPLSSTDLDIDLAPDIEEFRQIKKLRSNIKVVSALKEQLDSVLPFLSGIEKYKAALEIIATHVASTEEAIYPIGGIENYVHMYM